MTVYPVRLDTWGLDRVLRGGRTSIATDRQAAPPPPWLAALRGFSYPDLKAGRCRHPAGPVVVAGLPLAAYVYEDARYVMLGRLGGHRDVD